MKQLKLIITSSLGLIFLSACGASTGVAPSQNSALNSITDSNGKDKSGYMQENLDGWLKDDWTPTVEKDKTIQAKYMEKIEVDENNSSSNIEETKKVKYVEKKDKNFTLQEYVDKAAVYIEAQEPNPQESNVEKMKSMPVIGE